MDVPPEVMIVGREEERAEMPSRAKRLIIGFVLRA
jgi:hypothetical protein